MYVCVSFCLLLRRSNLGHLPKKLLKCDLLRATMNGDPAGSRTGDLSAQSPRLYYCGSPLHIALPNFYLIFKFRHRKNNNRCIKLQFQCDLSWILKCKLIAANRTFAKSRFAANRTATKIMVPKQKRNYLNWMTTKLSFGQ